jgi:hypothetical protein
MPGQFEIINGVPLTIKVPEYTIEDDVESPEAQAPRPPTPPVRWRVPPHVLQPLPQGSPKGSPVAIRSFWSRVLDW